jgi:hypothetical protein
VPLTAFVIQHFLSDNNQMFNNSNNTEPHIVFPHVAKERYEDTAMSVSVTTSYLPHYYPEVQLKLSDIVLYQIAITVTVNTTNLLYFNS